MTCKIEGCPNPVYGHGLCAKHYFRQRRHGDAAVTHKPGPKPSKPKPQPKIGVVEDAEVGKLRAANERLCEEKRRALAIADERSKENVELRREIEKLWAALEGR